MSSTDFRQIAIKSEPGKGERLFRAAVSAFCSLTRPTARDAAQLDDLTLPLYDRVSPEGKRYAAAALSECRKAPAGLVRRLAGEPVEIAAPILVRSAVLGDVDLLALIGRQGLAHALAIGRRSPLNPAIAELIAALEASVPAADPASSHSGRPATAAKRTRPEIARIVPPVAPAPVESARAQLRTMMAVGGGAPPSGEAKSSAIRAGGAVPLYDRLKATALSGTPALFQTALADGLEIGFAEARALTEAPRYTRLMSVLRGLDLSAEQAFLLTSAAYPTAFPHAEAMRLFIEAFDLTHPEAGRDEIRRLKGESVAAIARVARKSDLGGNEAAVARPLLLRAS
ncbi:MAG: hypothetical protein Q8Q62_05910 [Mesorhizobium sp.]|nr:hypothetical protein [Mesorhizobium sp.]